MVALTIFAFCSASISSLMFSTYNTSREVRNTTDATSQTEIACRRIIENVRSAADVLYTDPTTGLLVQTPPDSRNIAYIYIYYVKYNSVTKLNEFHEKIEQATTGNPLIQDIVLIDDVASFSVTTAQATSPKSYTVSITSDTTPPITRTFTVTGRNL